MSVGTNYMGENGVFFDEAGFLENNLSTNADPEIKYRGDDKNWRRFIDARKSETGTRNTGEVGDYVTALNKLAWPEVPKKLMTRVHGANDFAGFCDVGERVSLDILKSLSKFVNFKSSQKILDFGCGCGRVLYPLANLLSGSEFWGTDIDAEAIAWMKEASASFPPNISKVSTNPDMPPTHYPDGSFDLIYAISVFTHLPQEMQDRWFTEMVRLLRPGGLMLISTQNQTWILPHISNEVAREFLEKGMYYFPYGSTEGLPDYYQAAWHTEHYMNQRWKDVADLVEHVPFGINDHQDISVYRKGR